MITTRLDFGRPWIDDVAHDAPEVVGAYDMHWYGFDSEVLEDKMEPILRDQIKVIESTDPFGASKPHLVTESGIQQGRIDGDQQYRVRTFEYGVLMADYVAQVARSGWQGALAWDLDDAMHVINGAHRPDPPDDRTFKIWGFWNSLADRSGNPSDRLPRPWFYTWALMSRLFPNDSRILSTSTTPSMTQFRTVAGLRTVDGKPTLSVMLVNDYNESRFVRVHIPSSVEGRTVVEYHYFDNDRPVDAADMPTLSRTRPLSQDRMLTVFLPGRGVLFLQAGPRR